MDDRTWIKELPAAVTVCDARGVIVAMNEKAAATFAKDGGLALVGKSLLACHPEPARTRLEDLLARPRVNAYTIEKGGRRKLIYQAPWYEEGRFRGLVEISMEVPSDMPHFVRDREPG